MEKCIHPLRHGFGSVAVIPAGLLQSRGATRLPHRLPVFFNRDCDDTGSGFDRSAYEMPR